MLQPTDASAWQRKRTVTNDPKDEVLAMQRLPMESDVASRLTYWCHGGRYQADYNRLQELLVPDQGSADTEHGEFLRHCSNVYYDVHNNGGGNLVDGGRSEDLQEWLSGLEQHGYPAMSAIRKLFQAYRVADDDDDEPWRRRRGPSGFKRKYPVELEEAVDFTILKVKEIHERLQQRTPGATPPVQQAEAKKARHRK